MPATRQHRLYEFLWHVRWQWRIENRQEAEMRKRGFVGAAKLAYRGEYTKPLVEAFFAWLKQTVTTELLLPTNPFGQAAAYALKREAALKVFLTDPDVPIDTNLCLIPRTAMALGSAPQALAHPPPDHHSH